MMPLKGTKGVIGNTPLRNKLSHPKKNNRRNAKNQQVPKEPAVKVVPLSEEAGPSVEGTEEMEAQEGAQTTPGFRKKRIPPFI